jgi:hypothetical protein
MKKLFAVLMLSAFTFGGIAMASTPTMKSDTTKKSKAKKDTTAKPPMIRISK